MSTRVRQFPLDPLYLVAIAAIVAGTALLALVIS